MKRIQEKKKSCSGCMPQLVNVEARVDESVQGPRFPQKKNQNLVNLMRMPRNWCKLKVVGGSPIPVLSAVAHDGSQFSADPPLGAVSVAPPHLSPQTW